MNRFVLVTNIPTPYRIPFFNSLAAELSQHAIGLQVLYCARREPNRQWDVDLAAQQFDWKILKGVHVTVGAGFTHLNPGVVSEIRRAAPRWLLLGGAWHLPTIWLASRPSVSPRSARILWTEGHADAVLNRSGVVATLRRRVLRGYDAFAVPNGRSGDFALSEAGCRKPTLPLANTVDEDFYTRPEGLDRASLRHRLGVSPASRVVVSVAQLDDRKGVLEVARGYGLLPAESRRDSILVFLGDGEQRAELEAIAAAVKPGEVRVLGHVSGEVVREWLWAADLFCLATRLDPNPLSPIEASFAQLPLLVSTKAGNIDELVRDGETGWRLDRVEAAAIRDRLAAALATDEKRMRELGRAAAENANASFRRASVAKRFVSALLEEFPG